MKVITKHRSCHAAVTDFYCLLWPANLVQPCWLVPYSSISVIKNKKMKGWYHPYLYYGAERHQNKGCTAERCNQNGGLIARDTALRCRAVCGALRQTIHCPLNIVHRLGMGLNENSCPEDFSFNLIHYQVHIANLQEMINIVCTTANIF